MSLTKVTYSMLDGATFNVLDYGAVGNGIADDTAALQAAIDAAGVNGGAVYFPAGNYKITSSLTLSNGVRYFGDGINDATYNSTVLSYSGTQDAVQINNPINASTAANILFENINIVCAALSSGKALFYDTGSSYLRIRNCKFSHAGNNSFGVVFDQTEVSTIEQCVFDATGSIGTGANIWLANGATAKNPTGNVGYTNRISLIDNQINAALGGANAVGVIDDGGTAHTFDRNNYNGGAHAVKANLIYSGLQIIHNEIEGQTVSGISFPNINVGAIGVVVDGNSYVAGTPFISLASGAIDRLTYTNNTLDQGVGVSAESGLLAGVSGKLFATQNRQRGLGGQPTNNYLERNSDTVGVATLYGSSVAGSQTYAGQTLTWRLIGDVCFFNLYIALSAFDAATSGSMRIGGLPFSSRASSAQTTSVNVGWSSYVTLSTGYTQIGGYIPVGADYIALTQFKTGASVLDVTAPSFANNSQIMVSGMYPI